MEAFSLVGARRRAARERRIGEYPEHVAALPQGDFAIVLRRGTHLAGRGDFATGARALSVPSATGDFATGFSSRVVDALLRVTRPR